MKYFKSYLLKFMLFTHDIGNKIYFLKHENIIENLIF